jgi:hypothetical protein
VGVFTLIAIMNKICEKTTIKIIIIREAQLSLLENWIQSHATMANSQHVRRKLKYTDDRKWRRLQQTRIDPRDKPRGQWRIAKKKLKNTIQWTQRLRHERESFEDSTADLEIRIHDGPSKYIDPIRYRTDFGRSQINSSASHTHYPLLQGSEFP